MAEKTPFTHRFGLEQGRVRPTGFYPQDGDYAFVLGSEYASSYEFMSHDKLEIYQNIDLTGAGFLRIAAGLLQPKGMPKQRAVSGHYEGDPPAWVYTATLKYTEVLGHPTTTFRPMATAEAHEPYTLDVGATLKLKVNGGSEQTVSFGAGGILSAAQVVAIINAAGLSGAVAQVAGLSEDQYVQILASFVGRHATLQISGGSTYPVFRFPLGSRVRLIAGNAANSLTHSTGAAHIVGGGFSSADVKRLLKVGHSSSVNNGYYLISAVGGLEDITLSPAPKLDETGLFLATAVLDGVYDTRVFYGGDDLSAIIAPDADFTAADAELPIRITGASHPGNNFVNFISSVQSASLAILRYAVVDEPVGFDAVILGALWKAEILIDDVMQFSVIGERDKTTLTNDIAVNVSKLTGTHKVGFRLELVTTAA
jgi:hypothetical protein